MIGKHHEDIEQNEGTPRRRFLNWLFATSAGALVVSILYPILRYIVPPASAAESAASSVTLDYGGSAVPANSGRIFKFGSEPGMLLRSPTGDLRAFSAVCTHLACTVQYREDLSHIWCACHNGHYDLNGVNIAGPPPRPLERYEVRERGDQIVVQRRS